MSGWDYANLSQMAKAYGGPEAMLNALKTNYGIGGGLITLGIVAAGYGAYKLVKIFLIPKIMNKEDLIKAEKEIILGIKEYDNENNPNQSV